MALSGAPDEFRYTFHDALKGSLRALPGVTVLDFSWTTHGPEANSDASVYELDKSHTESADLCVFILDYPSLGLGMEVMLRHQTGKPSLFFVHQKPPQRVSRMVLGYLEVTTQPLHTYTEPADIVAVVQQHITSLS